MTAYSGPRGLMCRRLLPGACVVLVGAHVAFAQDAARAGQGSADSGRDVASGQDEPGAEASGWRFEFAPYLWAVSLDGDARVAGEPISISAPFTETLADSDTLIGLMGQVEVGYDRWSLLIDGAYTEIRMDDVQGRVGRGQIDAEASLAWLELGGAAQLFEETIGHDDRRRATLDVIGGARLTSIEIDLDFERGGAAGDDETWVEPFVGARSAIDVSDSLVFRLRGDVGGFGAGSEFSWSASAVLGWSFPLGSAEATVFGGYRALSQDYEDGEFEWDVISHGPIIGVNFAF
ncbi:MAG: hypothetical protein ACF8R7_16440 [Phycisphaerales bacterium JB039]